MQNSPQNKIVYCRSLPLTLGGCITIAAIPVSSGRNGSKAVSSDEADVEHYTDTST